MVSSRLNIVCVCLTCALLAGTPACGEDSPALSKEKSDLAKDTRAETAPLKQTLEVPPPAQPVGQPPEKPKPPEVATIFEQPGVTTPKGTLILEPSFQFVNSSSNRVALSGYTIIPSFTVGLIDVRNVNSNTYVAALSTRYGITNRLEIEARVPYVYRSESTSFEPTGQGSAQAIPASVFNADGNGLGDVEFGPRYQLNQSGGEGPFFIASLRIKSITGKNPFEVATDPNAKSVSGTPLQTELPTGSGFWGFQPSLTAIYSADPAVFFGTVSYMYNVERDIVGQGKMDPGDTVGFNLGIGVALNEKSSFSIGYDHIILGKPKRNGNEIPGSIITQVGSLLIGCSYKLTDKTTANFSLGAGLTPTASNVQLTLRLPTSFLLGK